MSPVESDEEDLTRKQRREQARTERKAMEEAEAAGAARRKRLTQLTGVATVVVVAIVIILVATGGGGKSKAIAPGSKVGKTNNTKVDTLLANIPQKGNVLGSSTAPATLQYFGDLECPICKEFTLGALPSVIEKWVRAGKLKIEYRSLETATREPEVFKTQQVAALAAGKQNKMWYFVETFYHDQGEEDTGYVNEKYLQGIAEQVPGLDLATWTSDRSDSALEAQVSSDGQAANNAGFTGTPSFLLGKSGETPTKFEFSSLTDASSFNEAMEKLLA